MPADQGEDLLGLDRRNRGRATRACNKLVSKWNVCAIAWLLGSKLIQG